MEPKAPQADCEHCPLKDRPFVPPYGDADADFVFVGEAPGKEEVKKGRPFVGKSGELLRALLDDIKLVPRTEYYTNAVMCQPEGNARPTPEAIVCCSKRLQVELDNQPGTTVALGNAAVDATLGIGWPGMKVIRGAWYWSEHLQRMVMPTWHPAYILREPNQAPDIYQDLKRLHNPVPTHIQVETANTPPTKTIIETPKELWYWTHQWEGEDIAFDYESNQVDWTKDAALMLAFTRKTNGGFVVTADMLYDEPRTNEILNRMARRNKLIGHNAKFDIHFANKLGWTECSEAVYFDTMLASYTLDERPTGGHGLKPLSRRYFDVVDYDHHFVRKHLATKGDEWSKVPFEDLSTYGVFDVCNTLKLKREFERQLRDDGLYYDPFMNVIMKAHALATYMEELGMYVDTNELAHWREIVEAEMFYWEGIARDISGHPFLNLNSPKQLAVIIWDERKLPQPPRKTWDKIKGQVNLDPRSTSEVALFHLANVVDGEITGYNDPFLQAMFNYRRRKKILSTYIDRIVERTDSQSRYHDDIKPSGTETGRLATFLHTIPRETTDIYGRMIRSSFKAGPGYMFSASDFSQAELRAGAAVSEDPFLIEIYDRGSDVHTEVCAAIFGPNWGKEQRIIIKRYNFAYLYGGGRAALVSDTNIPKQEAHRIMKEYDEKMKGLATWKKGTQDHMLTYGYVQTPFGRRRRFPYINDVNVDEAMKAAVNVPIQSTAADLTTLSGHTAIREGIRVMLTKHDEIIAEVEDPDQAKRLEQIMEDIGASYFPRVKWKADYELRQRWSEPPESSQIEAECTGWRSQTASH